MRYIILVFVLPLNIFANSLFINLDDKHPSRDSFDNFDELSIIYDFNKYQLSTFISIETILKQRFEYKRDFDDEFNSFGYNLSLPLGDYLGFGFNYTREREINKFSFSPLFRNSYLYLVLNFNINHKIKQQLFLGALFKSFSPFFHLDRYNDFYSFTTGLSIIDIYGFDFSYSFKKLKDELTHSFYLSYNFSYFTTAISTKNKSIDKIYLNLHSKSKNNYLNFDKYSLIINLDGDLKEYASTNINSRNYSFLDIIMAIKRSINDKHVDSFIFNIEEPSLSISNAEELIKVLKKSKKPYYVYLRKASLGDYILAANSNLIAINPATNLDISGPSMSNIFFSKLLKTLGVDVNFFKQGNYKTAPEIFTNEKPSNYFNEESDKIINDIKNSIKLMLTNKRKFLNLEEILNNAPYSPINAKKLMLVDRIEHFDSFSNSIVSSRNTIIVKPYNYYSPKYQNMIYKHKNKIAVLVIDGVIVQNKSSFGFDYRKNIQESIRKISHDSDIKSVIIRINSPGGDGLLSEEIYHWLVQLKKMKKIFVSISSVGASGGYYIALASDKIYANKTSIVGSIGVYSGKFVVKKFLEKLNIFPYIKNFWENSSIYSPFSALSKKQKEKMKKLIDSFYELFLNRVSKSRKIKLKTLKNIAQGKIFTAKKAVKNRLIDENYSFSEVLDISGFDEDSYELIAFPENSNFLKKILGLEKKLKHNINTIINILVSDIILIAPMYLK